MNEREALRRNWERIEAVYVSAFVPEAQMKRRAEVRSMLFDIELHGHDAGVAKMQAELDDALAVIEKVRALHHPHEHAPEFCAHCVHPEDAHWSVEWPCPTAAALGLTAGGSDE